MVGLRPFRIPQNLEPYPQDVLHRKLGLHRVHHDASICTDKRKGKGMEARYWKFTWQCCRRPIHYADYEEQSSLGLSRGNEVHADSGLQLY